MKSVIGLSVLIIDNDEDDALIVQRVLDAVSDQRYQVTWSKTIEDGLDQLSRRRFDVTLFDYRLWDVLGSEYLTAISTSAPEMPVMVLTEEGDRGADDYSLDSAATDYLAKKDLTGDALHQAIQYAIERQSAYEALSRREHYYRNLFQNHPSACLVYDRFDQTVLAVNEAASHLYEIPHPSLTGQPLKQLFARADTDFDVFLNMDQATSNPSRATVWTHRTRSGEPLEVELQVTALDYQGQAAQLLVISDRTPQIRADRDARESERALLQLLSDSRDAIVVLDKVMNIQYANRTAECLLGLETSQWGRLEIPLDGHDQLNWHYVQNGQDREFEVLRSPTRWSGQPMTMLTMRDITERKQTHERLRLFERSLESSSNGVVIVDTRLFDDPISYVNPAFTYITGYNPEEVMGKNCRFLQREDNDQASLTVLRQALSNQQSSNVVVRNYRKDGTPFWNDLYIAPVADSQGVVTHFVGVLNDISAQREIEHTLAYNASHDVLTGLPNRSLLIDRIDQAVTLARRYQRTTAVLYIDLDEFKPVNDALGHSLGDRVLVETGRRLSRQIRSGDTLARISADEFIVLLPDLAKADDVVAIAEALLASVREPMDIGESERVHLTASIGIALSDGTLDDSLELIRRADMAMFQSKVAGRNHYRWYEDRMSEEVSQTVRLRGELEIALEQNQFFLCYQPQLNLLSGKVVGLEALIRWQHPTGGTVSPGQFISAAENNGQIRAITEWVVEQACIDRSVLSSNGFNQPIAINLSPVLFKDADLKHWIEQKVVSAGLSCADFELEIVESVMMGTSLASLETLNDLRNAGFRLSIDDFGTGFSSLNYLKHLPIQKLKIDQSFVNEIIHNQNDASIVRAIISIARNLGIDVIAEGVETEEQAAFLRREHCHNIQGFLYSPAIPIEPLLAFLRKPAPVQRFEEPGQEEPTLLIVDDEPYVLKSLNRCLRNQGYRILTAESAEEAFRLLASHPVHVILSDQRMPVMSGTEFLKQVRKLYPGTIRMIISGYTDLKTVTEAINEGAIYKFLTKPWDDEALRVMVSHAFNEAEDAGSVQ
ncbi:EAL domain-containing protein [Saccharospirillum impatiens]|uniref:EAL domain-containing protein n=1 Tax=Saccharospirillum impatiens TaxID=169438 RepID=UPI000561272B|nr:EAL domain-containing protein [Saccharospirillum impatiens]